MLLVVAVVFIVLKITAVFTFAWPLVLIPVFVLAAIWLFHIAVTLASYGTYRKVLKKIEGKW